MLENSQMMKMSNLIQDAEQKEKMHQMELIEDVLMQGKRFEVLLRERTKELLPILNFWKKGQIMHSL